MNNVNKTLYIPLYGKAYVSQKGIILQDKKAEEIWAKEAFLLKGKSKSKWLAYYMGIRSAVFDNWLKDKIAEMTDAVVLHVGCGMDSRVLRVGTMNHKWYDVDFPEVIHERRKYYTETDDYKMFAGDARNAEWLQGIPSKKKAIVVMEGVSMYMTNTEVKSFMDALYNHFDIVALLMDCYTVLGAKLSKYKNPINEVGVREVYGVDDPMLLESDRVSFVKEHDMTPGELINELSRMEKLIFKKLYAGKFAKKLYRLFEFKCGLK